MPLRQKAVLNICWQAKGPVRAHLRSAQEHIRGALRKVRELRSKAKTELQKKALDSLEVSLLFDEPPRT
jgi:hypothetical protein